MLQPRVRHFLETVHLGAPHFTHIVKPSVKVRAKIAQPRIVNQNAYDGPPPANPTPIASSATSAPFTSLKV
jgi:hypothetical protein